MGFDFGNEQFALGNIACNKHGLDFGDKSLRAITIVDPEQMNLPNVMQTYKTPDTSGSDYPSDNFSFLLNIPAAHTVLYNQVVFIPDQLKVKKTWS